jgi:hypothetical protein
VVWPCIMLIGLCATASLDVETCWAPHISNGNVVHPSIHSTSLNTTKNAGRNEKLLAIAEIDMLSLELYT